MIINEAGGGIGGVEVGVGVGPVGVGEVGAGLKTESFLWNPMMTSQWVLLVLSKVLHQEG